MAVYFTDSSAAAKRYLTETGSRWVKNLFAATPPNSFFAVATIGVEVVAAITRRARGGTISQGDAVAFCALFLGDLGADYQVLAVTDTLLGDAIRLAQSYGLRGYDAVQLAAANEVNHLRVIAGAAPIIFVSADRELNAAARGEGLAVDDPNAHP